MKECDKDNAVLLVFLKREANSSAEMSINLLQKKKTASRDTTQDLDKLRRGNLQITTDRRHPASARKPLRCIFMKFFGIDCRSKASFVKIGLVSILWYRLSIKSEFRENRSSVNSSV